ncbi:MAG: hypothetical protein AAFZ01_01610 [Pseudomonadota bacterium]
MYQNPPRHDDTLRAQSFVAEPQHAIDHTGGFRTNVSGNGWGVVRPRDARAFRSISETGGEDLDTGALRRGRQRAPGAGNSHGGVERSTCRIATDGGPRFDPAVPPGGYLWWYVDAISDDGQFGLTLIAFVGSVFSPYYAWSGRHDPDNHCALNVALYGRRGARWAMTERPASRVTREADAFNVGSSSVHRDGDAIVIRFDERGAPFPRRVKGEVRVTPEFMTPDVYEIDSACQHSWWPISPRARIEVTCGAPDLSWSGSGYLDMNAGDVPLEETFHSWNWARAHVGDDAAVLYHVTDTAGDRSALAVRFDKSGQPERFQAPHEHRLRRTGWWVDRAVTSDSDAAPRVVETYEDTPFYARSHLHTHLLGHDVDAVHESLALHRFARPSVKFLLPFRMPRLAGKPLV